MAIAPMCLLVLDQLIGAFLIGPLVVFVWRGTFTLMDMAGFDPRYSLVIGITGIVVSAFIQPVLINLIPGEKKILWNISIRIYTYVMGIICVNVFRGVWGTTDHYMGLSPLSHSLSLFFGYGTLLLLRATRNTQAPGTLIETDVYEPEPNFFGFTTRFRQKWSENKEGYVLDVLFTCFIIHPAMVLSWRGIWGLMDNFLYPEDYEMTAWVTLFIAYTLFLCLFPLQIACDVMFRKAAARDDSCGWWGKVLSQQLLNSVATVCSVSTWRGVWFVLDIYLWPHDLVASSWLTHGTGFGLLMLMLASNSVVEKGCFLDGEGDGNGGCLLQNRYLRIIIPHFKKTQPNQTDVIGLTNSQSFQEGTDNLGMTSLRDPDSLNHVK